MGMFASLFGSSGSDKADKMRQQALDAFGSVKTPELSALQVQLNNYVNAGKITPEQAEAALLNSNAFNEVKTDPSLVGAQKQALQELQDTAHAGGLSAIDKSQLQDITNQQNQVAKGRNEAIMQNAQERGVGGSGLEFANRLSNEQQAADMAAQRGTDVASQAQQRALQELTGAATLGGQMESQQYGEQAQKAAAQNAISQFNAQNQNQFNLYNTQAANEAQAANLANAQNVENMNTATQNQGKMYNAAQNQTVFNDQMAKAQGQSGVLNGWANDASAAKTREQGADMSLLGGAMQAGAGAAGFDMAGPTGGAVASQASSSAIGPDKFGTHKATKEEMGYADGGAVEPQRSLEDEYSDFVAKYCHGGTVNMANGGKVTIKPSNPDVIKDIPEEGRQLVKDKEPNAAASFKTVMKNDSISEPADFSAGMWPPKAKAVPAAPVADDYRDGGQVPGVPKVPGDSFKNDFVPAKLSPGEIVLPRSVVAHPGRIPGFIQNHMQHDITTDALKELSNPFKR